MPADDEFIRFRQSRDVGAVITATFAYLRQNWRSLGKALLYIVGPVLAVQLVVSSLFQDQIFAAMQMGGEGVPVEPGEVADLYRQMLGPLLLMLPANLLVIVLSVSVVYEHMRRYQSAGPGGVTVAGVWEGVKDVFGTMLSTTLAAFFGGSAAIVVVVLVGGVMMGGLTAGVGPVGTGLGALLMLLGFVGVGAYLLVLFALLFPVRTFEDTGLGEAVGRVRRLLEEAFWKSLGVVFVVTLLYYVMATAFSMPASILGFIWGFGAGGGGTVFQVVLVAANVVGGIGSTAAYGIPLVAAGLYYFGLVEEKEHAGLAERVEQVGERPSGPHHERGGVGDAAREQQRDEPGRREEQEADEGKQADEEEDDAARWRPPAGGPGDA